jgi:hypothetical protein
LIAFQFKIIHHPNFFPVPDAKLASLDVFELLSPVIIGPGFYHHQGIWLLSGK